MIRSGFKNISFSILSTSFRLKSTNSHETNIFTKTESKVPQKPIKVDIPSPIPIKVDEETISLLEHLSLVDCGNKKGIETLEDAILFADRILHVNTDGVEPMYTVLEDRDLRLRNDEITEGSIQKDIMKNAKITEEGYFVSPPGNIPIEPRQDLLYEKENEKQKI